EIAVGEPRGFPQPRVRAGGREAGDGVDLVQDHAIAVDEEVHARHARGVDGAERGHGGFAHARGERGADPRGYYDARLALDVLRRVVVPFGVVADFTRQRRLGRVVTEDTDLDLARPVHRALHHDLSVVPRGLVERRGQRVCARHAADAHTRAQVRRLHEAGKAGDLGDAAGHLLGPLTPLAAQHDRVLDDR